MSEVTVLLDYSLSRIYKYKHMDINNLLKEKREGILRLAEQHGAYNVRIFGSVARGEAGPASDIDVLVNLTAGRSLFDLGGLLMDLQDMLGCNVHLLTEGSLHWYIKEKVLKEAVPL